MLNKNSYSNLINNILRAVFFFPSSFCWIPNLPCKFKGGLMDLMVTCRKFPFDLLGGWDTLFLLTNYV